MVAPRASVDIEGGTLSMLAALLGMILDRPVIDKTGLTNYFEIHAQVFARRFRSASTIHD